MKDKYKLIIGILSAIIVILIIVVIILLTKINKLTDNNIDNQPNNNDKVKQMVGVYQNNNWNGREALIQLNEDMTCKTPNSSSLCNWNIEKNKLLLYFSAYKIVYSGDENENPDNSDLTFTSSNQCEDYIKQRYPSYSDKLSCEFKKGTKPSEYTITNNSIVYHDKAFIRIG